MIATWLEWYRRARAVGYTRRMAAWQALDMVRVIYGVGPRP